jgi:uncharacterized membrane protein HdeD (DUF308 family)
MATETDAPLESVLRDEGRTLMVVGGLLAVLGFGATLFPLLSSLTVGLFIGGALAVAGFAHVAHAFSAPGWRGAVGEILLAVVFLVAGLAMLLNPVLALTSLTLLVVAYFVAEGAALLYLAWSLRAERGWTWPAVSGGFSLLLAGLLFAGFPATAAWALGLLFGVNLLSTGISMVVLGRAASADFAAAPPKTPRPETGV